MAFHGLKINKTESPDKTPYTVYYPHSVGIENRKWTMDYLQFVSIDPARKNYALRIERRYHNGSIIPIVFDKIAIASNKQEGNIMICETYQNLTNFLNKYRAFYEECHFIVIERQLPQNYQATRISQHSISYFSLLLADRPLLPAIIEVDPKLKGKMLGAPKGINDKQLKTWAVETARKLLVLRNDSYSLGVLNHFGSKQDDLSDTICQIEALIIAWGLPPTGPAPTLTTGPTNMGPTNMGPTNNGATNTVLNILPTLSQTLSPQPQLVVHKSPVNNNVVRTKKPNLIMMVDNAPKRD
jgi:hypothetical protein